MSTPTQRSQPSVHGDLAHAEPVPTQILRGLSRALALGLIAAGTLWAGGYDATAWASAISAVMVVAIVLFMSATNGSFWER